MLKMQQNSIHISSYSSRSMQLVSTPAKRSVIIMEIRGYPANATPRLKNNALLRDY